MGVTFSQLVQTHLATTAIPAAENMYFKSVIVLVAVACTATGQENSAAPPQQTQYGGQPPQSPWGQPAQIRSWGPPQSPAQYGLQGNSPQQQQGPGVGFYNGPPMHHGPHMHHHGPYPMGVPAQPMGGLDQLLPLLLLSGGLGGGNNGGGLLGGNSLPILLLSGGLGGGAPGGSNDMLLILLLLQNQQDQKNGGKAKSIKELQAEADGIRARMYGNGRS